MAIGFDTAVSGLLANQKALEVTGHNVANLGTAGFARQSAIMASAMTRGYGNNWYVEMGVDIQQIRQIRHTFNDNIYRAESNNLGYWESRIKAVNDLESILGEPIKKGFQTALNNFWDSFQELSKSPESLTVRALVKQRSDTLVNHLNQVGSQINKLQSDLNVEIKARINEVNDITEQIAQLNTKIMSAEAAGNLPNDYYDQRNTLVDRLSKLVKAETSVTREGSMDIVVGGYFLVSKGKQTKLVAVPNDDLSHFYTPKLQDSSGDITINVGQGIIKGLLESRGEVNGAKGSYENGTPNTTADVTLAVDVSEISDPTEAAAYLDKVKKQAMALVDDLKKRGLDYNIRLVTYGGSNPGTSVNIGKDISAIEAAINGITLETGTDNDFGDVVDIVTNNSYGDDVNKYLYVFTDGSINGDDADDGTTGDDLPTDDAEIIKYLNALKDKGITLSVTTDTIAEPGEKGWDYLTGNTGGKVYDNTGAMTADELKELGIQASSDINKDVNTKMSTIPDNLNIISSVRKQLNALINIMAREVNYLHQSGKTLTGNSGMEFFQVMESTRPIELGNIKINDDLKDVNNIAASIINANGDNRIALAIANLRNANLMTGNNKVLSLDTYYQNIILDVGNKGYEAESMVQSYRQLVEQADGLRQSVMGVSLDEEMANMIKYKYAYNANSKVIDVVNQMMETILFRLGAQ